MSNLTLNSQPTYIDITFEDGIATKLNHKDFSPAGISTVLSRIAKDCGLSKDSEESILTTALKSLSEKLSCNSDNVSGVVKMKLCNGTAVPFIQ